MHSRSEGSPGFRASPSTGSEYRLSLTCVVMLESSPVSQHVAVSITPSIWIDSGSSGICISSSRSFCSAVVPGVFACVHMYMLHVCACMCACMYVYRHACMYVCACTCVYLAYLCIGCESQYQCLCVLGSVMNARVYSCAYVCVCMYIYVHFFEVSVACTLKQVFWALVHEQRRTLHRRFFKPTYTSASTLAAGCAHMCIRIYVCICMHTCIWMRTCVYDIA